MRGCTGATNKKGEKTVTFKSITKKEAPQKIIGIDMAAGEDMTAYTGQQYKKKSEAITDLIGEREDELEEKVMRFSKNYTEICKTAIEKLRQAIEPFVIFCSAHLGEKDKWQVEKLRIPNNKRKRRKIPMVRRRAHIRNKR